MLDIKRIRENPELLQQTAERKGLDFSVAELLARDAERRELLLEAEKLRRERNALAERIARMAKTGDTAEVERMKEETRTINRQLAHIEERLDQAERQFTALMLQAPNWISPDTPIGRSDEDNVELRRVGSPPVFAFPPKDHVELGELHDLFDIPRGVKVAGSRSYFLKGAGFFLHRAVQQLALDLLAERGFTIMDVPLIINEEALANTGFFPSGREQTYELAKDRKFLAGTSEAPLVSYYAGEVVDASEPIRLAAVSNCFRREAGSAGRDVRGLYRVHQFAKVEQVVICKNDPELSEQMLQQLTENAEQLMQLLELPYRVVAVCTGDMGQKNYKQYDIEAWMPSRENYGETHSASNLHEFQARRSNLRYRDEGGRLQYCHTLNCTAVATPRILIPLLEIHQQEDGSIRIPEALRKYMNGMSLLTPPQ